MRDINNYTRSYAKGKSFEFTEWSKLNNYTNSGIKQDFVTYGGSLYTCICDVAAGNESPDKDTIHWKLAVAGSFTERKDLIKLLGFEPVNPNTTNNFTKSQTFNAGINLNNTRIRKVKNPENDNDAANKQYVDDTVKTNIATQVTYAELKALRDAGKLVPGTQYRITDYQCTTTQANTKSAGHVFDIIVTADDDSTLNEVARAVKHEGDTYFANSNLSAWKLWYCLDNDTNRFAWASTALIEEKIDTIKPASGSASGTYTYSSPISRVIFDGSSYYPKIGVRTNIGYNVPVYATKTDDYTLVVEGPADYISAFGGISIYAAFQKGKGVIYRMIDEWNNDCPYDFKNMMFKVYYDDDFGAYKVGAEDNSEWSYTFCMLDRYDNKAHDVSVEQYKYIGDEGFYYHTYDNRMSPHYDDYANASGESNVDNGAYVLNANVFVTDTDICYVEEDYSFSEFYAYCNNAFGNDCYSNTFGSYCYSNVFGNDCSNNSFGNGCYSNAFGNGCYSNTFGNSCYYNAFGNGCYSNAFGNGCYSNVFGNDCSNINFASSSSATTKYNYYRQNHFGDGCQYIIFKGAETASSSAQVQNYNFAQGLQGTSSAYLTIDGVRNLSYETKVAKNSNGELKIYCEADLIL